MNQPASSALPLNASTMLDLLSHWTELGWLRAIDLALSRFLQQEASDASPELLLASALASHQLGRGHICLDLEATLADPYMALSLPPESAADENEMDIELPADRLAGLSLQAWQKLLQQPELVGSGPGNTPLVLSGHRLYLRRYWQYERSVEQAIAQRMAHSADLRRQLAAGDLPSYLSRLFPTGGEQVDWQKIACALAAASAFAIVTGGPGTGKTTTVVKLLALLQSMALADAEQSLQIKLAAPTGKAAARLKESIAGAIGRLPKTLPAEVIAAIPNEVTTLHRLLGSRPNSRQFVHHARNPLALDVLVVDEASMVDLEMMAALLTALPAQARLILLGDKDQLASVEAGSVLGQLCSRAEQGHFDADTAAWIGQVCAESLPPALQDNAGQALDQHVVMLRQSHRFTAASGIGQLAAAVNAGDSRQIEQVLQHGYQDLKQLNLARLEQPELETLLLGENGPGYADYLRLMAEQQPALNADPAEFEQWAGRILQRHGRFQLLCALRNGPFGVGGLNPFIEGILQRHGLLQADSAWYAGRPILVTQNDYRLGLMNGDIGITLPYPQLDKASGQLGWSLRVAFLRNDGSGAIHWVLPSRLLAVETVFALTVHKSQGSEFEHCALILPAKRNPILTRELVYTGITRAKQRFSLISAGNPAMIQQAADRTVLRSGGLFVEAEQATSLA